MDLKLDDILERYLNDQDIENNSRVIYKSNIRVFLYWVKRNNLDLEQIKHADIIRFKRYLHERYKSIYTVRNYFTAVELFYKWADRNNLLTNITSGIKKPKFIYKLNKLPLENADINKLLHSINRTTEKGKRDYALIILMLTNGLRTVECIRMDIGDVFNRNDDTIIRIHGKGRKSKEDLMPLSDETLEALNDYLVTIENIKDEMPLFRNESYYNKGTRLTENGIYRIIKSYYKKAGLGENKYSPHSLRHTTAVMMFDAGYTLYEVQLWMRHRSPDTTEIYLRFIEERDKLNNRIPNNLARMMFSGQKKTQKRGISLYKIPNTQLIK